MSSLIFKSLRPNEKVSSYMGEAGKIGRWVCQGMLMALFFLACSGHRSWDTESEKLMQQADLINEEHAAIIKAIDSLWDSTSVALEESLPADFPPTDRDIFLKARNADHIRMFQSFKRLSPEVQLAVDQAGQYDAVLAKRLHDLHTQNQAYLYQKSLFLERVGKMDSLRAIAYAQAFPEMYHQINE